MTDRPQRRDFLKTAATTAIAGLSGFPELSRISHAHASDLKPDFEFVPVDAEIESLVRLIYSTPQERIVPVMVDQVRRGLSYRRFLAANFIAAIRYHLGSHSVFVTHSLNQVAMDVDRADRLLPLYYHVSVLRSDVWKPQLKPIAESDLPPARKAADMFASAMRNPDKEGAKRAMLALARNEGSKQAFRRLWFYSAERNYSSGGHTAIAVSNAYRTLQTIGWHHAEPVLQFLVNECCRRTGGSDLHRVNAERTHAEAELPYDWPSFKSDRGAVLELLTTLREGSPQKACRIVFDGIKKGRLKAGSIWDAVFLTTAELMIRYKWCGPNKLCGHSVTCTNALHYSFRTVGDRKTRLFVLLEAVEWTTTFLRRHRDNDTLRDSWITDIAERDLPKSDNEAVEQIFSLLPPRRFYEWSRGPRMDQDQAMQLTFALAKRNPDHRLFLQTARHLLCRKATREVHDFKYPIALFEHYRHATAEWRPHLLAASAHYLHGSRMEDAIPVQQVREALGKT